MIRQARWPLALVLAAVMTAPAAGETLDEAWTRAYANNPSLLAQRARLRVINERVSQALGNWRPTLNLETDTGKAVIVNRELTDTDRRQQRDPTIASLSIVQPIYRGGRTLAQTRQAENQVRAERARLWSQEQVIFLSTATSFMDVLRDQAVLQLTLSNEQRLTRQLEATQDRFRVGEITRTDVFQAEARLARATADRIDAEGGLEASRATYRNVVGEVPGQLERPAVPLDLPGDLLEAIDSASTNNPNVISSEFDTEAARDTIDLVRGELLPVLQLEGRATRSLETSSEDSHVDNYEATLNLNVPLYQQGIVYSRLRAAKQNVIQNRRLLDQERRDAVEAATRGWNDLQSARAQVNSFQKQVEANEVALEGVEREASVGARTVLDILDAEQELLDSQVSLVRAQRDELVAIYQLKTALGELTARRLGLPVDLYDPEAHYNEVRDKWFGGSSSGQEDNGNAVPFDR